MHAQPLWWVSCSTLSEGRAALAPFAGPINGKWDPRAVATKYWKGVAFAKKRLTKDNHTCAAQAEDMSDKSC